MALAPTFSAPTNSRTLARRQWKYLPLALFGVVFRRWHLLAVLIVARPGSIQNDAQRQRPRIRLPVAYAP